MLEELKTLVALQEVDNQFLALEKAKGDLPQRVQENQNQIELLSTLRQQKAEALSIIRRSRRSAEGALELAREKKKKYENQLYAVTTNKEYDAVTTEIEAAALEIDQTETKILEAIEQEETLSNEVAEYDRQLVELRREHSEQQAILETREAQARSMVEELQRQREKLIATLQRPLLNTYQRILNGKDGLAVVPVTRGTCSGCLTRIPAQRVLEIREMNQIFYCESCGRILVWNDMDDETVSKSLEITASVAES